MEPKQVAEEFKKEGASPAANRVIFELLSALEDYTISDLYDAARETNKSSDVNSWVTDLLRSLTEAFEKG